MTDATLKTFNKCVRKQGRLMQAEADKGLGVKRPKVPPKTRRKPTKWVSAFVEVRWFADAEGFIGKFRVILPDERLHSSQITFAMEDFVAMLSSVRKVESPPAWYGLKVLVTYDGAVSTELNSDPNCVVDPTWFKS
jgi:hypothetical protein